MTEGLSTEEIKEEEYEEDKESSGFNDLGRDSITGY